MKTDALIHKLAIDLEPVKPMGRPIARFAWWLLVAAAWTAVGIAVVGTRADLLSAISEPAFLIKAGITLGTALLCVLAAFALAVPDKKGWLDAVPVIAIVAWFLMITYLAFESGSIAGGSGLHCVRNLLIFCVPTGAVLYLMLKRAAPLRARTIGVLAAFGAAAFASLGTQFICQNESALHVLIWHVLPVVALCFLGAFLGEIVFRWKRVFDLHGLE